MSWRKYDYEDVAQALIDADGIISEAARIIGCSRRTVYRYIEEYKTVRDAHEQAREANIDRMERRLMDAIDKGSITAIKFGLATIGKHRGYVKRQEYTGADGDAIQIEVIKSNVSNEDI